MLFDKLYRLKRGEFSTKYLRTGLDVDPQIHHRNTGTMNLPYAGSDPGSLYPSIVCTDWPPCLSRVSGWILSLEMLLGIKPWTFHMQSRGSTTELQPVCSLGSLG